MGQKMKVVSISDYGIQIREGRAERVGKPYINRLGNLTYHTEFREFYKTKLGRLSPEEWFSKAKEIVGIIGENELLDAIVAYCKENCAWLRNTSEKRIEEYAIACLASGAYTHWKEFKMREKLPAHKAIIFEMSDFDD